MALLTSGTISISDLVALWGGIAPHAITEYYGNAELVPNVTVQRN